VQVTVAFTNLEAAALPDEEMQDLGAALAGDLASACDVENASVVDLTGANATVTFGPRGRVSAFVRGLSGLTAHELAARLYSASFRATLGNSTARAVGAAAGVQVASVSLEPKAFVPATASTTATTTTATTTMSAAGTTEWDGWATTRRHEDMRPEDRSGANSLAAPMSFAVLVAAAML